MSRTVRRIKFRNLIFYEGYPNIQKGSNKKILKDGKNQPRRRNRKNTKRQIKKYIKHRLDVHFKNPYNKARLMANHNFFTV